MKQAIVKRYRPSQMKQAIAKRYKLSQMIHDNAFSVYLKIQIFTLSLILLN
jgi:hypothetical protein